MDFLSYDRNASPWTWSNEDDDFYFRQWNQNEGVCTEDTGPEYHFKAYVLT